MRIQLIITTTLFCLTSFLLPFIPYAVSNDGVQTVQSKLAIAINKFAFKLYRKIGDEVAGKNVFMSPASISTALGMVYLGTGGDTRAQMTVAMNLDGYDATTDDVHTDFKSLLLMLNTHLDNCTLDIANRLFGRNDFPFSQDFKTKTNSYYHATLEALDFHGDSSGSRTRINNWVADQTSNKIKDLLPEGAIDGSTVLVLVNAIYFKGLWLNPFNAKLTSSEPFHLTRTEQTTVDMMKLEQDLNYYNYTQLACHVIELPYVGKAVSMLIVLPYDVSGLRSVESQFERDTDSLKEILTGLSPKAVNLKMPKFVIDQGVALKQFLQAVGMVNLFDSVLADLSGIDGTKRLYVSEGIHKAYVEVNEEGTEAAGSTGFIIKVKSGRWPLEISVDRPFLFLIIERRTNNVLFLGRLTQPQQLSKENSIGTFGGKTGEQRSAGSDKFLSSVFLTAFSMFMVFVCVASSLPIDL